MALSERLRLAQARARRARELPAFLTRIRDCTGLTVTEADLLSGERRAVLAARAMEGQARASAQGAERRTPGLSRAEVMGFAARLGASLEDRRVLVGFGATPPGLLPTPLSAVLAAVPAFVEVGGWFSAYTDDGESALSVDLLAPGDHGNRHPEGSYEVVLRGPLFDSVDLPELTSLPPRPVSARATTRATPSGGSPLGPAAGKLPG